MDPSTHWVATVNSDGSSSVKVITSKCRAKDFILGPKSKEDMKLAKAEFVDLLGVGIPLIITY
jgi:hypothetical protein